MRDRARDKSDPSYIRERIGGCGDRRGRGKRSPGEIHGKKGVYTLVRERARTLPVPNGRTGHAHDPAGARQLHY